MTDDRELETTTCTIPLPRLTVAQDALLRVAFWQLMATSSAVDVEGLADACAMTRDVVVAELAELAAAGRVGRNRRGQVTGALGLTIDTTPHELVMESGMWHTWCVIDALGILGALAKPGSVRSTVPATGQPVDIHFTEGRPAADTLDWVVFLPDHQAGAPVIDTWCPSVNFFPDPASANRWAASTGVPGHQVSLSVATAAATERWSARLDG